MESHGIARYTSISDIYTYVYLLYTNTHRHTSIYLALLYCHPFWVFFLEFGPWKLCSEANHHWKPGRGSHGSSRRVDVVELTSCWGGFFFFKWKKTASLFFRPLWWVESPKKLYNWPLYLGTFCLYLFLFFGLAWRENSCTNWNGLHGRSEVAAWGSICKSIWDSRLKSWVSFLGSGTSGVENCIWVSPWLSISVQLESLVKESTPK